MKKIIVFALIVLFFAGCNKSKQNNARPDMIPLPYMVELTGGNFAIKGSTDIIISPADGELKRIAESLSKRISGFTGKSIAISQAADNQPRNSILLKLDSSLLDELGKEGYKLSVTSSRISIAAAEPAGLFMECRPFTSCCPLKFSVIRAS
jgi:hexosaminidase